MDILDALLRNGMIFSILVISVILMTRSRQEGGGCSFPACWQSLKKDLKADEMNRLKGVTLLLVAVGIGGIFKATAYGPQWLYESFSQCAYMFGAAVAAVFLRPGYEAAAHKEK